MDLKKEMKNLIKSAASIETKEKMASLLKTSPDALIAFEKAYKKYALEDVSENFYEINSRQASQAAKDKSQPMEADFEALEILKGRIVDELLSDTSVFTYDGKTGYTTSKLNITDENSYVTAEDIAKFPKEVRPQLSGMLMSRDMPDDSYPHLLWYYDKYLNGNEKMSRECYHRFRQGLDILDLDPVMYEIIGKNPNSMGFWFPELVKACANQEFFKLPKTKIAKIPMPLLQLTRKDYFGLTRTTFDIVNRWAQEAFDLSEAKEYFIKTGTYSSKFDFRNAYVFAPEEILEIGEYLLFIHFQALQMASPLAQPCIYGVSTTNEWVVREYIEDVENNPCIYKGMPLHTEFRVFVDCNTDEVIGIAPYWEPETMKRRFSQGTDANSPHQTHDYIIYKAHEDTLMKRYYENKDIVIEKIKEILPELHLPGQWSVDVMMNGNDFYIIDMALAENSAFYDCVPKNLRNPSPENWIPEICI